MARWGKGKLAIIPALAALVAAIGYLSFLGGQAAAEEDYIRETLAVYHGAGETGDSLDLIVGVNYDFSAVPIPHTLPAGCRAASPATVTWSAPDLLTGDLLNGPPLWNGLRLVYRTPAETDKATQTGYQLIGTPYKASVGAKVTVRESCLKADNTLHGVTRNHSLNITGTAATVTPACLVAGHCHADYAGRRDYILLKEEGANHALAQSPHSHHAHKSHAHAGYASHLQLAALQERVAQQQSALADLKARLVQLESRLSQE